MAVVMTEVRRMWRELTSGIGLGDRVTARGNGVRCAADVTALRVLWGRESSTSWVGGTASRCDTALWNGAVGPPCSGRCPAVAGSVASAVWQTRRRLLCAHRIGGPFLLRGHSPVFSLARTVRRYDVEADQWTIVESLGTPRFMCAAVGV